MSRPTAIPSDVLDRLARTAASDPARVRDVLALAALCDRSARAARRRTRLAALAERVAVVVLAVVVAYVAGVVALGVTRAVGDALAASSHASAAAPSARRPSPRPYVRHVRHPRVTWEDGSGLDRAGRPYCDPRALCATA